MKLDEYQEGARSTAIYPGILYYPTLGLVGEFGELLAALQRNDHEEIPKEIGDVLWYCANVAADANLTMSQILARVTFPAKKPLSTYWCDPLEDIMIATGIVAENVKKTLRDNGNILTDVRRENIRQALAQLLWGLVKIAEEYALSLKACAIANLEKLRSRQERGVIKGDGDSR
jgi:NTP pyrophosphatase (non-canonical NTP hydrolase)